MDKSLDEILAERESVYGDYTLGIQLGHSLMRICEKGPSWGKMSSGEQYATIMICSQLARVLNGNPHNVDSWANIAGYATRVVDHQNQFRVE